MRIEDIKNCSFSWWYPLFKNVTIRRYTQSVSLAPVMNDKFSELVDLTNQFLYFQQNSEHSDSFLKYLHADGIVLPEG